MHQILNYFFRMVLCWLLGGAIFAIADDIANKTDFALVYTPPHESFAQETLEDLQQLNPTLPIRLTTHKLLHALPADTILITLGKSHLEKLLNDQNYKGQPVISNFISRHDYHTTLATHGRPDLPVTALFSDPPLHRQLKLINLIAPSASVAIVYDQASLYIKDDVVKADQANLDIRLVEYNKDNINSLLIRPAIMNSDFLLASYNPAIYNANHLKNIVFTLLRRKQVLVGYSSSWVDAGAMATTYSNRQAITHSLADFLQQIIDHNGQLTEPVWPSYFSVKINNNIANALGFHNLDEDWLLDEISRKEDN